MAENLYRSKVIGVDSEALGLQHHYFKTTLVTAQIYSLWGPTLGFYYWSIIVRLELKRLSPFLPSCTLPKQYISSQLRQMKTLHYPQGILICLMLIVYFCHFWIVKKVASDYNNMKCVMNIGCPNSKWVNGPYY